MTKDLKYNSYHSIMKTIKLINGQNIRMDIPPKEINSL